MKKNLISQGGCLILQRIFWQGSGSCQIIPQRHCIENEISIMNLIWFSALGFPLVNFSGFFFGWKLSPSITWELERKQGKCHLMCSGGHVANIHIHKLRWHWLEEGCASNPSGLDVGNMNYEYQFPNGNSWQLFTLTLYSLTSVCIFSILLPRHFLRFWQGEFVQQSRASLLGAHLLYPHDLDVWFRVTLIVGRN